MTDEVEDAIDFAEDEAVNELAEADNDASESQESAPDEEQEEQPRQKKSGVQKRIDTLTREKYELEAQAKFYAEQLRRIESNKQQDQPAQEVKGVPKVDDYDTYEAYIDALTEYKTEQRFKSYNEQQQQERVKRQATEAQMRQQQAVQQRILEGRTKYADFDDVALSGGVTITQEMASAIGESELGADLAYYLGSHPEEAAKIANMGQSAQYRALGRIEAKLESQPVNKSNAPAPIKPVSKGAKSAKNPDNMSIDEWMAWRMKTVNS